MRVGHQRGPHQHLAELDRAVVEALTGKRQRGDAVRVGELDSAGDLGNGVVDAQLPERFNKADAALTDLKGCVDNIAKAPHDGWLREPYYHLAVLYDRANDQQQAQAYLQLSGHDGFNKPITLTTPFAVNATKGFTFHPQRLREIVPGKIFNLSGFELTEYYFIV